MGGPWFRVFSFSPICESMWVHDRGGHEDLAKFGYRSEREVDKFRIPPIIWLFVGTYSLNMVNLDFIFFPPHDESTWTHFFKEKNPFVPFASSFFFFFFASSGFKKSPPPHKKNIDHEFHIFSLFFSERGPDWTHYYMIEWPPSLRGLTGSFLERALLGPFPSARHGLGSVSTLTKRIIFFPKTQFIF